MGGAVAVIFVGVVKTVAGAEKQTGDNEYTSEGNQNHFEVKDEFHS